MCGKSRGVDAPAEVFAQAERACGGLADPVVQLAGFPPQAELAGADVAGDAFGGGADARQFVIVDGARAVHGDVIQEAALHQVDQMAVDAGAQHVGAHHEDARRAGRARLRQAPGHDGQIRMREGRRRVGERQPAIQVQIVASLA